MRTEDSTCQYFRPKFSLLLFASGQGRLRAACLRVVPCFIGPCWSLPGDNGRKEVSGSLLEDGISSGTDPQLFTGVCPAEGMVHLDPYREGQGSGLSIPQHGSMASEERAAAGRSL